MNENLEHAREALRHAKRYTYPGVRGGISRSWDGVNASGHKGRDGTWVTVDGVQYDGQAAVELFALGQS